MPARTSQLQIRVSPDQKATLKRLAAAAGQSVSAYVLAQALPTRTRELQRILEEAGRGRTGALGVLRRTLAAIPAAELPTQLASVTLSHLPPVAENEVAAVLEQVAHDAGVGPPLGAASARPLELPHFRWPLASLRAFQLRVSPVTWKRRNLFAPPDPEGAPTHANAPSPRLQALHQRLADLELDAEFYFIAGALVSQTFPAAAATVRPSALFSADPRGSEAIEELGRAHGWEAGWVEEAVREAVESTAHPTAHVDLPRLKAFSPPTGYALTMKLASCGPTPPRSTVEDLRFLLRAGNLTTPSAALACVTSYLPERHLPAHTHTLLAGLLGH